MKYKIKHVLASLIIFLSGMLLSPDIYSCARIPNIPMFEKQLLMIRACIHDNATIRIEGDKLLWRVDGSVMNHNARPGEHLDCEHIARIDEDEWEYEIVRDPVGRFEYAKSYVYFPGADIYLTMDESHWKQFFTESEKHKSVIKWQLGEFGISSMFDKMNKNKKATAGFINLQQFSGNGSATITGQNEITVEDPSKGASFYVLAFDYIYEPKKGINLEPEITSTQLELNLCVPGRVSIITRGNKIKLIYDDYLYERKRPDRNPKCEDAKSILLKIGEIEKILPIDNEHWQSIATVHDDGTTKHWEAEYDITELGFGLNIDGEKESKVVDLNLTSIWDRRRYQEDVKISGQNRITINNNQARKDDNKFKIKYKYIHHAK